MSIDYDRLRELADTARPGPWEVKAEETSTCGDLIEGLAAWIEADNELVFGRGMEMEEDEDLTNLALAALAPDMARELLRLRGVVEKFDNWLTVSAKNATTPATKNMCLDAQYVLTKLLEGDTE